MIRMPRVDMHEVTQLTREGRLQDALDMLLGRGRNAGPETCARSDAAPQPSADVIDLVPPILPGAAWTAAGPPTIDGAVAEKTSRYSGRPLRGLGEVIRDRLRSLDLKGPAIEVPVPPGARFEQRQFEGAYGGRAYKLYVPSSYRAPCPLVVMLHGCTQNPDDFALGTGMNALAERDGFLVAYPAQTTAANPSKCWNWFRPDDQQRGAGEPAIIAGLTRAVATEFAVDPTRIYVAGLSAGGAAAVVMGATYPDLYAAIGVHSGLAYGSAADLGSALAAMRGEGPAPAHGDEGTFIPTIVFHGDADPTVHPANAERIVAALRRNGRAFGETASRSEHGAAHTRIVLSGADGAPVVEHWTLKGSGHAWSGGNPQGSFTDPRGPDASAEMIRFFGHHRLEPAGRR